MRGPRLAARQFARAAPGALPATTARFSGYGLLSLPLESGDVFAFRHCAASSLGPPFNCVWHREPDGRWTLHVDVAPARSCWPFLSPALAEVRVGEITLRWRGRHEVSVCACDCRLNLAVRIAATPLTRMLGAAATLVPPPLWRSPFALRALGRAAGLATQAGTLPLSGRAPAGHEYRLRPAAIWHVAAAAATLAGRDLGSVALPPDPPRLGELALPRRALLAALTEEYTTPAVDPAPPSRPFNILW